ncbi:sedoheptulose-bisphosphatase, partial [Tremellales sp. Uapishka_1]
MVKKRMPRVYLVRHGETEWSLNGRHTGTTDIPLTANGERIVKEMAPRVIGKDRLINPEHLRHVIVSPRQRAQRTADLLFSGVECGHVQFKTEPLVSEWDYGKYEGMLTKDIKKEKPDWSIWEDGCPPGDTPGETVQQMSDRVDSVIAKVRAIHSATEDEAHGDDWADVMIFSHGHFSRVFIARWCELPLATGYHFAADAGGVRAGFLRLVSGLISCQLAVLGYQHMTLKEPWARVITGAGSGGLLAVTAIILSDLVSLADRGLYQGGVNVLFGAGAATGAVVGGWVADKWGWRMAFWMQIPPIVFSALLVFWKVHVPHMASERTAWEKVCRIDWAGSLVLMICISSLSLSSSLTTSSGYSISHPLVWGLFSTFCVTLPLFIYIEKKAHEPILPLSMLTRVQPTLILFGFVCTTATNFSRLYNQPVYLHVSRGLNGSQTGLVLLPSTIVGSASSLYAGWHMRHYKEYKWFQLAMSLIPWLQAISIIIFWSPSTNIHELWIEMAIGALGGGATITSLL